MNRLAAVLAAVAALVAVPGGLAGAPAACAAADANTFAIAVDFGDVPGAPANTVTCVPVDDDDTAADALAKRAEMLGRPKPTYDNAGLLCSIDGFPQSSCGERTAAGYRYWSYWFGGESWSYASTGPAFHRARPGGSVGWRFQPQGAANATDPPPRFASRHSDLCPKAAASRATTTAPPAAPQPSPPAASPTTTTAVAGGAARPDSEGTAPTSAVAGAATSTSTVEPDEAADDAAAVAAGADGDDRTGGDDRDDGSRGALAVAALGFAAALGAAAAVRARRR